MRPRILLASASPRRRELLSALGIHYRALETNVREISAGLPPAKLALLLARKKAERAGRMLGNGRKKRPGWIIVGADTVVAVGRRIFGKPRSCIDARRQLSRLSARGHSVITGLAILDTSRGVSLTASECSAVRMRRLSGAKIKAYVDSGEPMGKAGSYAIQGKGGALIASLGGDYFNVVGFPLRLFARLIPAFGLRVSEARLKDLYRKVPSLNRRRLKY